MKTHNIIAVTGADSGLGAAICAQLERDSNNLLIKVNGPGVSAPSWNFEVEEEVYDAARFIQNQSKMIEEDGLQPCYKILINCAGVNYIEWFDQADFGQFDRLMAINVRAPMLLAQELIGFKPQAFQDHGDWFSGGGAILNIVSNASHMPMTNSAFYNASKGAMHIATLAMARELRKTHGICIFGISPNKLRGTGMSSYIDERVPGLRGWTPEQAASYQLNSLPAGDETPPEALAEFIAFLLQHPWRHRYLTNTIIPYGA